MPRFTSPFKGTVSGDRYARDFFAGDECPESLLKEAEAKGAIPPAPAKKTAKKKDKDA